MASRTRPVGASVAFSTRLSDSAAKPNCGSTFRRLMTLLVTTAFVVGAFAPSGLRRSMPAFWLRPVPHAVFRVMRIPGAL